jgi:hypothetical protein
VALGLTLSLVLPFAAFLFFNVRDPAVYPEPPNIFGVLAAWLVALFVPGFSAGLVAKRRGWLYGGALALVPIGFAAFVGYQVPIALVTFLWAVGFAGGFVGQRMGQRRHAL